MCHSRGRWLRVLWWRLKVDVRKWAEGQRLAGWQARVAGEDQEQVPYPSRKPYQASAAVYCCALAGKHGPAAGQAGCPEAAAPAEC